MTSISVDARDLRCPLPLLKLKQALAKAEVGDKIEVWATDAGSWRDIPAFIDLTQHQLCHQEKQGDEFYFCVLKGA